MPEKPNFVLISDDTPPAASSGVILAGSALGRLRSLATSMVTTAAFPAAALFSMRRHAEPPIETTTPVRPRLVFAVDATASREPAWATARQVTDALVKALPGQLDVALAVHGGSRVHTFTSFTSNAAALRDRAAGVACQAGTTRLLPILAASLKRPGVRVVIYIGDVFEENMVKARQLADTMGEQGRKLIVLHDTTDPAARRDAELFWDLAKRTGGCVLPFDASALGPLRDLLSAVAVYAVGGEKLLRQREHSLPGAIALLEHLGKRR